MNADRKCITVDHLGMKIWADVSFIDGNVYLGGSGEIFRKISEKDPMLGCLVDILL